MLEVDFSFFRGSKQENIAVGSRQNFNGKIKIKNQIWPKLKEIGNVLRFHQNHNISTRCNEKLFLQTLLNEVLDKIARVVP